jgi:Asp-tRNA(Asn)/Glu-tRNA(Gln) amidotransferase A subunit family amidase
MSGGISKRLFSGVRGYNRGMEIAPSPIAALLQKLSQGDATAEEIVFDALTRANGNASTNTYLAFDAEWSLEQARGLSGRPAKGSLAGLPVALKDCFDLQGFVTSSGSRFYARHLPAASADSWVAERLKAAGAVITGKTHLHQLAYGITGENRDYGNCLQPDDASLLTGGSSSGSAAAIQEGSALAAIGTDTGGSVRAPAALCGLAGYRASLGVGNWRGGAHLTPSCDTIGWLCRDLRDLPLLAHALFGISAAALETPPIRVGCLRGGLMDGCDVPVLHTMQVWEERVRRSGAETFDLHADFWSEAYTIYAPIQAHEASALHTGFYGEFEPAIAERLSWGAAMALAEVAEWRMKREAFVAEMNDLFTAFDFLLLPTMPLTRLVAGADHAVSRARILPYTTPASLAGLPAVVLPARPVGMQLLAARGRDAELLTFAKTLGEALAAEVS